MAFTFPTSPAVNDTYTINNRTYTWTGTVWEMTSGILASGQIVTNQIANNAVTTDKIAAGAVEETDIATGAVTAGKLASGAVASNLGFTPASTGKSIAMSIVFGG